MNKNVKLLLWSLVVVPFVVAIVVFCSLKQNQQEKSEMRALSSGEMLSIVGGAEGEGCININRECTGSSSVSCSCETHSDWGGSIDTTPRIAYEYAGEDFSSPNSSPGSNTKAQLVQVENKPCYKELRCESTDYQHNRQCDFDGNCGEAYFPYSICVDWELAIYPWVTFKKGYCLDP
ncbi:MAG: hypothetical protein LBE12_14315 [Planctomycetaceae bacterium]|jgi:hypothetical protein|nr:hypothetical protein [Planctomycetaceae bacterium]